MPGFDMGGRGARGVVWYVLPPRAVIVSEWRPVQLGPADAERLKVLRRHVHLVVAVHHDTNRLHASSLAMPRAPITAHLVINPLENGFAQFTLKDRGAAAHFTLGPFMLATLWSRTQAVLAETSAAQPLEYARAVAHEASRLPDWIAVVIFLPYWH